MYEISFPVRYLDFFLLKFIFSSKFKLRKKIESFYCFWHSSSHYQNRELCVLMFKYHSLFAITLWILVLHNQERITVHRERIFQMGFILISAVYATKMPTTNMMPLITHPSIQLICSYEHIYMFHEDVHSEVSQLRSVTSYHTLCCLHQVYTYSIPCCVIFTTISIIHASWCMFISELVIILIWTDSQIGSALHWRHNDHGSIPNHHPEGCLLNCLFRRRSKKTSKLRVTGLCVANSL